MKIYLYDGSVIKCDVVEFSYKGLIIDEYKLIPSEDVVRIVAIRKEKS
jgi:hypothetical protein